MKPSTSPAGHAAPDLTTTITEAIRGVSARARGMAIHGDSRLFEDLALDSLDMVAVVIELQDQLGVEIDPDEISAIHTVADLAASLQRHVRTAAA